MLIGETGFFLAMLIFWRTRKVYSGFGFWTAANLVLAIGLFLLNLRGYISDLVSVVISNFLLMAASLLTFIGIRQFWGKPYHDKVNYALAVFLALASPYFLYVSNDINIRIVIYSFCSGIVYLKCAANLIFDVSKDLRPSAWYAGGVFIFLCGLSAFRVAVVLLNPLPNDFSVSEPLGSFYLVGSIFATMAWVVSIFMLTSRRVELELNAVQIELRRLASTDFLTGISNRRTFFELSQQEFSRARRHRHHFALLTFDIDRFKDVNDAYGHAVGDQVLQAVVLVCKSLLRDSDILARVGGEEFAILLPETERDGGILVAEKLRLAIAERPIPVGSISAKITVSIGMAILNSDDKNMDVIIRRADAALYEAKRRGRNCVVVEPPAQDEIRAG